MLANHLGAISVDQMLAQMTPEEFVERLAVLLDLVNQDNAQNWSPDDPLFLEHLKRTF